MCLIVLEFNMHLKRIWIKPWRTSRKKYEWRTACRLDTLLLKLKNQWSISTTLQFSKLIHQNIIKSGDKTELAEEHIKNIIFPNIDEVKLLNPFLLTKSISNLKTWNSRKKGPEQKSKKSCVSSNLKSQMGYLKLFGNTRINDSVKALVKLKS